MRNDFYREWLLKRYLLKRHPVCLKKIEHGELVRRVEYEIGGLIASSITVHHSIVLNTSKYIQRLRRKNCHDMLRWISIMNKVNPFRPSSCFSPFRSPSFFDSREETRSSRHSMRPRRQGDWPIMVSFIIFKNKEPSENAITVMIWLWDSCETVACEVWIGIANSRRLTC